MADQKTTSNADKDAVKIVKKDENPKYENEYVKGPSSTDTRGSSGDTGGLKKTPSVKNPG